MLLRHYTHSTDPSLFCWHKWVCMSVQHIPGGGGMRGGVVPMEGGGKGGGGILGGKKGNSFGEDSSVSEDCSDTTWNHRYMSSVLYYL